MKRWDSGCGGMAASHGALLCVVVGGAVLVVSRGSGCVPPTWGGLTVAACELPRSDAVVHELRSSWFHTGHASHGLSPQGRVLQSLGGGAG